jgi:SAM-dependent methyltransferase
MKVIGTGYNSIVICGVHTDPEVTEWLGSLVDDNLKEDLVIVDCGCGNGRLAHYISKKIDNFEYIGIEVSSPHGEEMIDFARENFADERTSFDIVGSDLERHGIETADLVVFGSVFTHTTIEDTYEILDMYAPVIERGGKFVFSALISSAYLLGNAPAYSDRAYNVVYNTLDQYDEYADRNNLQLNLICESIISPVEHHFIYELLGK